MNVIFEQMLHTWATGGWVMPALAVVALITYATAGHLLIRLYHRGLTKATDTRLRQWVARPEEAPKNLRELIRYTQDEVHSVTEIEGRFREVEAAKIPEVDRRLAFLNIMVVSAPLFGLLGTVCGMLLTFKAIGIGGSSTSEVIARGISEALVATQTGMMVAIPGLLLAHLAKRWRNEYVAFLLRLEGITLRHFRPEFHGMTRIFVRSQEKGAVREQAASAPNTVTEPLLA
ncbi:MAG: MotA/TolQ/ExbB proton channel family protein [Verrucomicrobia subdivision 3 bacterium]|nr:MotA/TolQ/ExbB proton channel family protein [Limisphaerales bacterium]